MERNWNKQSGVLLSIGYGNRPWEDFLNRLKMHRVEFLVDVRSKPRSRQPEFNDEALRVLLANEGIKYLFMGSELGGRPNDPSCYVNERVDYDRCEQREMFQQGLNRLIKAITDGYRLVLMCCELDPDRCHRSKLIGEALGRQSVTIHHIGRDGELLSQEQTIAKITGGQSKLFGTGFTSREKYMPPAATG